MPDFLLEIGVEEIPDWMIEPALADLRAKFQTAFAAFLGSSIAVEATPRRLVLIARDLIEQAPDTENLVQGPYLSAGPGAANGFAKKNNTTIDKLATTTDAKGERYIFAQLVKGQPANQALAGKLPDLITSLTWPKTMFWTHRTGARFIRPIRWIVALLDNQVVPFEVAGVQSGNTTRGHRILGASSIPVTVANYFQTLRANYVIVPASERKQRIEAALAADVEKDEALLQTLTYLTEWPSTIRGTFDPAYLELPKEILSTVMRHHQRYFSVLKPDGTLAPEFVAVTNTDGDPDGLIRQGNEKVLRARFNDARFFWQVDQQKPLTARVPDLEKVTYQAKLGTYKDKTNRLQKLALELAAQTGADAPTVSQAALLSKTDLTTDMVKEFTELQGIVGGLYAIAQSDQGGGEAVGLAIYDHYKPVSMDDTIPRTLEGQIVALADKIDTLRECFRIGLVPTGSGDPFALRRAGQGVVKILFESKLNLELLPLIENVPGLPAFMQDRIQFYMKDVLELAYDEVAAALAAGFTTLADLADRAQAIHKVRATPDFEPLAASFKRIKNILKEAPTAKVDESKLVPGPETSLYHAFLELTEKARQSESYQDKLALIATLRPQVDLFFDKILVNDPDPAIRENRLALLHSLLTEFSTIADFSEIVTQGAGA